MRQRLFTSVRVAAMMAAVSLAVAAAAGQTSPPTAAKASPAPKTAWGEPDLQGIWTDAYQTPLQRSVQNAGKEFLTDEERAELDQRSAGLLRRDRRVERGTELDVAGAYDAVFQSIK